MLVIFSTLALVTPVLFPGEMETGTPKPITAESKKAAYEVEPDTTTPDTPVTPLENIQAENEGYGELLEAGVEPEDVEGYAAPAERAQKGRSKSGVEFNIDPHEQATFVSNPTTTGKTKAEVAKALAEEAEAKARAEAERKANQLAQDKLKAEHEKAEREKALREERLRKEALAKQEAQQKALEKKALEEKRKAQVLAAKKAREEAEEAAKLAKAKGVKKLDPGTKTPVQPTTVATQQPTKVAKVTSAQPTKLTAQPAKGRYLQIGAFSRKEAAENERAKLARRVRLAAQDKKHMGAGFGYKISNRGDKFVLLLGPATNDDVLRHAKPQIDQILHVNSFITGI